MLELVEKRRLGRLTRRVDKLKTVLGEVSCGDVKRWKLGKAYVRWRTLGTDGVEPSHSATSVH
jgi:hypothetical protein